MSSQCYIIKYLHPQSYGPPEAVCVVANETVADFICRNKGEGYSKYKTTMYASVKEYEDGVRAREDLAAEKERLLARIKSIETEIARV